MSKNLQSNNNSNPLTMMRNLSASALSGSSSFSSLPSSSSSSNPNPNPNPNPNSESDSNSLLSNSWSKGPRINLIITTHDCNIPGGVEALVKQNPNSTTGLSTVQNSDLLFSNSDKNVNEVEELDLAPINNTVSNGNGNNRNFRSMIKNTFQRTNETFNRNLAKMALNADAGKSPDYKKAVLYSKNENMSESNILWSEVGSTESVVLSDDNNSHSRSSHTFAKTITLDNSCEMFELRIILNSGATLLQSKSYTLAWVQFTSNQVKQCLLNNKDSKLLFKMSSKYIHNSKVTIQIMKEQIYPDPLTLGWNLTDPIQSVCGYSSKNTFYPPLQTLLIKPPLTITERAVESTVILPIAAAFSSLLLMSTSVSLQQTIHYQNKIELDQMIFKNGIEGKSCRAADCSLQIFHFWKFSTREENRFLGRGSVFCHYQNPKCVFEKELGMGNLPVYSIKQETNNSIYYNNNNNFNLPQDTKPQNGGNCAVSVNFFPPVTNLTKIGRLRIEFVLENIAIPGMDVGTVSVGNTGAMTGGESFLQGFINLDDYTHSTTNPNSVWEICMFDQMNQPVGIMTGILNCQIDNDIKDTSTSTSTSSTSPSLFNLLNMDTFHEPTVVSTQPPIDIRSRQLSTMGQFYSQEWLLQHQKEQSLTLQNFQHKFKEYTQAIQPPFNYIKEPWKRKNPSPFRPSSSRTEELLSGIPFNVHIQSITLEKINDNNDNNITQPIDTFYNVTCGAPADHAQGYGTGPTRGGLRRLEENRLKLAQECYNAKTNLITSVQAYFQSIRQTQINMHTQPITQQHHIPSNNPHIYHLRNKVTELCQKLAHMNWKIAIRRANVLSQAMGIALTSYLSSIQSRNFHNIESWINHGFLITFEGMLSTAGKEMGMIEDAAVAIDMLQMVKVRLVAADHLFHEEKVSKTLIYGSQFLRWLSMEAQPQPSDSLSHMKLLITIGVDAQYLKQLPQQLQTSSVQFYPILFQMGVDIRQWGANTGARLKNSINDQINNSLRRETNTTNPAVNNKVPSDNSNIINNEEEETNEEDNPDAYFDLLTKLNHQAIRKMNSYAYKIVPVLDIENKTQTMLNQQAVHPLLNNLWDNIRLGAGKMQHGVLVDAANSSEKLGGSGVVFCKSGKDRTAMQVTFKQAQFLSKFLNMEDVGSPERNKVVFEDATLFRTYGTRLAICEKNVGQPKYAFNALQVKFMPDMLKPPKEVLAGFLKGGRVFSAGGGIES